jgi:hypothetical protein
MQFGEAGWCLEACAWLVRGCIGKVGAAERAPVLGPKVIRVRIQSWPISKLYLPLRGSAFWASDSSFQTASATLSYEASICTPTVFFVRREQRFILNRQLLFVKEASTDMRGVPPASDR